MQENRAVLIVDDDPTHLKIYGWILNTAGFDALPVLVRGRKIDIPKDRLFNLVVLDYRLRADLTAVDAAKLIHEICPGTPIILLSDLLAMPDDIAPYVKAFVRKGEPEQLLEAARKYAMPAHS